MRFAVTGGRKFADLQMVRTALSQVPADAVLVYGAAPGLDRLAAAWWMANGGVVDSRPADWQGPCRPGCKPGHRRTYDCAPIVDGEQVTYCPAAGVHRNQEMIDSGVNFLIKFPGGTGTADMASRAETAGVTVYFAENLAAMPSDQGLPGALITGI